jgi:SecD/SecF fusion protein
MTPAATFFVGLFLLALFGWYFATDIPSRKRNLGLVLTVLVVAFSIQQFVQLKIPLGLDLKGGTSFLLKLTPQDGRTLSPDLMGQAVEVIRKRVDALGGREPVIAPEGDNRIMVQIPGLETPEAVEAQRKQLQQVAKLDFASVLPATPEEIAAIEAGERLLNPAYVIKTYKTELDGKTIETKLLVRKNPEVSGDHVERAVAYYDQKGYGVSLQLDSEGARKFDEVAAQHVGEPLAILLDGEVISAPRLETSRYHGRAQISGNFSEKEARELASALENPLRVPVEIEETRTVSPSLGMDSIRSGIMAGLSGLVMVFAFVMIYYRMAGIVAFIGLLVNLVILLGLMAMFQFVLTLPGIAGIILSIGMAVDANVLIYERLREETAAGKSLAAALENAYDKAFSAIFDANVTTLITSIILFWQATGSVKGFAVTLTVGIIASMFSALLVTRTLFRWLIDKGGLSKLSMLDLIPKKKFDFLGKRHLALGTSLVLILGSIAVIAIRGQGNLGIDFRGGDLLIVDSQKPVSVEEARAALANINLGDVTIQFEREGMKEMLSFRSPAGTSSEILTKLQETFPDRGVVALSESKVGPQIGLEFAKRAVFALVLGILGILVYVTVRFEFSFALATVAALLHDVIITLGLFSLIGGELSLVMVGAILTIAGYSVNDTIVVFDRIRSGLKMGERGSTQTLMNTAINETLGRTILTGGTTLFAVGALYFFGGTVLRDFSFAILVGILVGTYSSIFVASPIVLWWTKLRGKSLRREVLEGEQLKNA